MIKQHVLDALKEMLNQGAGIAAYALSQMTNAEVQQCVPSVEEQITSDLLFVLQEKNITEVCLVRQHFYGQISSEAILLLKRHESTVISELFLGDEIPLDHFDDLERESICEIGNIVLNAIFSSLANMLNFPFDESIPTAEVGSVNDLIQNICPSKPLQPFLNLTVNISIASRSIDAQIILLFDAQSLVVLEEETMHYLQHMQIYST